MKVKFCGATRTTTGSMFLLKVNDQKILLECGLYQGKRSESNDRNKNFPFDPKQVDLAILSHSHIDHCGNFPNLVKQDLKGIFFALMPQEIWRESCSKIPLEFSSMMQNMSQRNAPKGKPPVGPLYSVEDAAQAVRQFVSLNYDRPMNIADGVKLTFSDAGHILGSAQVILDIKEGIKRFDISSRVI